MFGIRARLLGFTTLVGLVASVGAAAPAVAKEDVQAKHVLLLSVDGMHQTDLQWYVSHHPASALAALVGSGVEFTNAQSPVPSDSYPGIVGQLTGGNPSSTGIWYDDSYNFALLPPGTKGAACKTTPLGTEVAYMELAAWNPLRLDSGATPPIDNPDNILSLTALA